MAALRTVETSHPRGERMPELFRVVIVEDDPDVALYSKTVLEYMATSGSSSTMTTLNNSDIRSPLG